ncbi:undecaprenyl-diphosphatase [Labrenzia sp. EL_208]|uniref:Undecaprenyl pyrophosphate phosphatase n=1 Tax=Roseibium album TaxID=311410 RepID=A0A0M6ZL50_9HYPH|nr:phosphatase PAP2 family protein [Roseibium album]MBG6156055.1 undecaprenyl-diphosphatase [Labrenzia sp. EL_162]MBG6163849.1 undecaprenyl-diphosphatase [Labrenzia sp. EL_195]MBG6176969.1 undecaprenyl-diphosphatase [Labrenzia sp. EL_132]MBG6194588.1 undecaprenyl-diphosphatase [Labrenzia sp. EL_159]MBG6200480.1 undecaprenyl-diphosphatase [Labrenzia sp. EL_13]MBG6231753.1 undecaprenyl-diphosphatase [Labrenzia sp. EL_208]MCR9057312.1 phosphatase PAP2 family protein [Paracoccaceae bacterium]
MTSSSNSVRKVLARMRGNIRRAGMLFSGRKARALNSLDPLPPGQRPQDILAILLLTVGVAVVVFDVPTYPWLRSLPGEYRNGFRAFTDFGKADWILISTGLTCLFLLALDAGRYAFRIRMAIGSVFTYAAFIFYSVAATGLLAIAFKWSLGRARPKLYEHVGPVRFDFLAFDGTYTSFPSGHSTTVAALATALAFIFPAYRWLIIVAAFWLAFSRVMVGAHYPSDVIAGTLLGMTFTFFTVRAMARRRIGFHLSSSGKIEPNMNSRSAKACVRAVWQTLRGQRGIDRVPVESPDAERTERTIS